MNKAAGEAQSSIDVESMPNSFQKESADACSSLVFIDPDSVPSSPNVSLRGSAFFASCQIPSTDKQRVLRRIRILHALLMKRIRMVYRGELFRKHNSGHAGRAYRFKLGRPRGKKGAGLSFASEFVATSKYSQYRVSDRCENYIREC